jgi:hypothetical protein
MSSWPDVDWRLPCVRRGELSAPRRGETIPELAQKTGIPWEQ